MEREITKKWDRQTHQGKSRKQVEDSCKIIYWGTLALLAALIISMIVKV